MQNGAAPKIPAADRLRASILELAQAELAGALAFSGSYDNASGSRLYRSGYGAARGGSADAHRDFASRDSLRRQAQQADRNNVLFRGLIQRLIDMVVGDGFSLLCHTADPEWNRAAAWLFNRAAGEPDRPPPPALLAGSLAGVPEIMPMDIRRRTSLSEQAAECVRCACVDGDRGLVLLDSAQYQEIEGERIANPMGKPDGLDGAGGQLVGGVRMTSAGEPISYLVTTYNAQTGSVLGGTTTEVPAEAFLFLANPLRKITGSTRGEPQLQAALKRFDHLDKFENSARAAAHIQACLAAIIAMDRPDVDLLSSPGETDTDELGDDRRREYIRPGMVKRIRPGEKVYTVTPSQPGPNYSEFVVMQVIAICADLGLPAPLALLDARQVNLSSIRSVMQFAWRNFERWQDWLKRELYTPVYLWRTARFIRDGLLPFRPDWMAHEFVPPPPPVMDPKLEIDAARSAIDGLLVSRTRMQQRIFGIDGDAEAAECARVRERDAELGIAAAAAPGSTGTPDPEDAADALDPADPSEGDPADAAGESGPGGSGS